MYPSSDILLDDCQGIVGHRDDDFDFHPFLSQFFPYVTNILFRLRISYREAPMLIHAQVDQMLEKHIKIGASFYPIDALGGNIDANFLDLEVNYQEYRFEGIDQGFIQAADLPILT